MVPAYPGFVLEKEAVKLVSFIYIHRIHRIRRRQHASEDDAGMSKHRLSP